MHIPSYLYTALYILFDLINGFFLYRLSKGFVMVKKKTWGRIVLFLTFFLVSGMVIWVGDNNFAMTLPFFLAAFLVTTEGELLGRLTVGGIFFCFTMSVNAIADTYFIGFAQYYHMAVRMARLFVFGLFYLIFYKHLPKEPIHLSHRLWKLCIALTSLPFVTLAIVILPTYWMPDSLLLDNLSHFQGIVILPMALLSSLVLLVMILVLSDYEKKEKAATFSKMREAYYQGLQREQIQVRTLRHDLRNHLYVVQGLLERAEYKKAESYLKELMDSPALYGSRRICENEIANVVLSAKYEDMVQRGLEGNFQVVLPRTLPIADTDLCALLGNALDNAIEAAENAKNKKILVRCLAEKGLFMLRMQNDMRGDEHADLSTTKKDKKQHGFGIAGMQEIAARYDGSLEIKRKNGKFELIVCLPLKENIL